jgi:hypothetical protein
VSKAARGSQNDGEVLRSITQRLDEGGYSGPVDRRPGLKARLTKATQMELGPAEGRARSRAPRRYGRAAANSRIDSYE